MGDTGKSDAGNGDAGKADVGKSDAGVPTNDNTQPDPSNSKTDYQAFEARVAKLRSCGLLDNGAYPFDPQLDQRCESLCMIAASCSDLKTEACDEQAAPALEACFDRCSEDIVTCGDGETVSSDSVCDLAEDCSNGEDEKHCQDFSCASGSHIGGGARCDGEMDCDDGSDEKGCALICGKPYATST